MWWRYNPEFRHLGHRRYTWSCRCVVCVGGAGEGVDIAEGICNAWEVWICGLAGPRWLISIVNTVYKVAMGQVEPAPVKRRRTGVIPQNVGFQWIWIVSHHFTSDSKAKSVKPRSNHKKIRQPIFWQSGRTWNYSRKQWQTTGKKESFPENGLCARYIQNNAAKYQSILQLIINYLGP